MESVLLTRIHRTHTGPLHPGCSQKYRTMHTIPKSRITEAPTPIFTPSRYSLNSPYIPGIEIAQRCAVEYVGQWSQDAGRESRCRYLRHRQEKVRMVHRIGRLGWVIPSSLQVLFLIMLSPILIFAIVIYFIGCPVTIIIVDGVLRLFPSRTGTLFFSSMSILQKVQMIQCDISHLQGQCRVSPGHHWYSDCPLPTPKLLLTRTKASHPV